MYIVYSQLIDILFPQGYFERLTCFSNRSRSVARPNTSAALLCPNRRETPSPIEVVGSSGLANNVYPI